MTWFGTVRNYLFTEIQLATHSISTIAAGVKAEMGLISRQGTGKPTRVFHYRELRNRGEASSSPEESIMPLLCSRFSRKWRQFQELARLSERC
jgi:hypothetical protein